MASNKRYQVFVSSTFSDLVEERRSIHQTLMDLDCIPAGMESFHAADEEQFNFIKTIIDDSDYYVLVIGGRYGSVSADGISYTEMEYEYARSKGIAVLSFVHSAPNELSIQKSDIEPSLRERLDALRRKVMTGRMVKLWRDPAGLPGLVATSLSRAMKMHPAIGWVRADHVATEDLLLELEALRKRNEVLETALFESSLLNPVAIMASSEENAGSKQIGQRISDLRRSKDVSLEALSKATTFPMFGLLRIERGEHVPTVATLQNIAKALGVPMAALLLDR